MQNRSMKPGLGKSVWWVRTILIEFLPDILPLSPPPSVSPWAERLFLARKREERERRSEKDLFICSLCFSLLFLSPLPCTFSVLRPFLSLQSLSPSFTPLSRPSSSLLLPLSVPVLLLPSSSWVDSGSWLISWRNSGCPHGTAISWKWLLGASRLGDLCRCSAGLQGIWKSLWHRHQVLVYVQDLRWSCG